jgi:DNA-binding transcriptional LysR family regulator
MADPLSSRELAAFAAAVETGSIGGAAEALDLTQSATTKRIQALERRLGVALLVRGRGGVRPSEEGMALYPEARRALDALVLAERAVATSRAAQPLRIAASHTVGEILLPTWLTAFRATAPGLHPQVDVVNSPGAIAAVREDRADVGFVEGLDPLDGLEARVVAGDEIVLVIAAGHRWSQRRSVRPQELAGGRYVSRESGSGTRAVAAAYLAEAGVALEPVLSMASLDGVKRALAAGGFALISRLALEPDLEAGRLVTVPIKGVSMERALTMIRRDGAPPRDPAKRFWQWLANESGGG